jgi:hypothetical protein
MASKPETVFKNRIAKQLKKLRNTWGVKIQQVSITGTPDQLLCIMGSFVALELKKDQYEIPTELQLYNLRSIHKAGGFSFVAYPENWDAIFSFLEKLSSGVVEHYDYQEIRRHPLFQI